MNETNNMLSTEFILQGSDVIISIFIIVAMSFVPASFTLFLVYERATKSKHLQYINGLYPLIYWLTNFVWDLLNYLLPATCVIVILRLFNVPAYVEGENFPRRDQSVSDVRLVDHSRDVSLQLSIHRAEQCLHLLDRHQSLQWHHLHLHFVLSRDLRPGQSE